jgi:hypothetical protein
VSGPRPRISHDDFARMFEELGARKMAEKLGMKERQIYQQRTRAEKHLRRQLVAPDHPNARGTRVGVQHAARIHAKVYDGVVLVGSDAHIWPGPKTTAMRAFIKFCRTLRPKVAILNGDVLDLARISRHPPIGWENRPTVAEEIDAGKEILHEIELAVPRECALIWTLGNHDARFETRLATVAPEYAKLNGVHLKDNFPAWSACWSYWINDTVVIKHRYKGGMGATRANTLNSGMSMVTGHLHSSKVTPFTDYRETRYGVDTGCLANPDHPAFVDYTEDGPKDWRSGFGVLTFRKGKLLMPELVQVWDDRHVQFRGELIEV